MSALLRLLRDETGVSASEYAMLLALIAGGVALGSLSLGRATAQGFGRTRDCINKLNGAREWGLCRSVRR